MQTNAASAAKVKSKSKLNAPSANSYKSTEVKKAMEMIKDKI
jgi:hypothetical protein